MPMSPDDRQTFSLKIANAPAEIAVIETAKKQLADEVAKLQKEDTANTNLFSPTNNKITAYHVEAGLIDGNQRENIVEQDILDASNLTIRNKFYPNDTSVTVPSLASSNNVWTKAKPFALTAAIGKNYVEGYTQITNEIQQTTLALSTITAIQANANIANTSGKLLQPANPTGTPPTVAALVDATAIIAQKTTLVTAINTLKTVLQNQAAAIVTNESDPTVAAQNTAAINNINNVIIPALNTWLAYVDFNATGLTTANYNTYNTNLLAPTKLHNVQLTALQTALNNRVTFRTTRVGQLSNVLGSITQDLSSGEVTASTGLYGRRYGFLLLRLDLLNGSLSRLSSMSKAAGAQDGIINSIKSATATYSSVLPTTTMIAAGGGTKLINVADTSIFNVGDKVFVKSETQEELVRAIASINGNTLLLNDIVPAKYRPQDLARVYKDIS